MTIERPQVAEPAPDQTLAKLEKLGYRLPPPLQAPAGIRLPFLPVRRIGERALIAGHGPLDAQGRVAGPFGKVGTEVSVEAAIVAARLTALAMMASLKRELGSLDRVVAWVRLFGMVNAAHGFVELPRVINGASDLILDVFGPERGSHARSAVGLAELPWRIPVEIEAEVVVDSR